ncbi:MAG: tetratricopeptide repeat protein [Sandaracinaceae bacterium]|nr:tetratricopeptide repeat protein [Sandaracinaceae bacterium]
MGQESLEKELKEAIEKAFGHPQATLVLIQGSPGSGKTRLLFRAGEIAARAFPSVRILYASARSTDVEAALFGRLLLERFAATPASGPQALRSHIVSTLAQVFGTSESHVQELAELLAHFAGIPSPGSPLLSELAEKPEEMRARELQALKRLLVKDAEARPLLVLIDNAHFADEESWLILDELLKLSAPILFVLAGNAPFGEEAQALRHGNCLFFTISPLGEEDVAAWLRAAIPDLIAIPEALLAALTHRSGGNPGALREIFFGLLEQDLFLRTPKGVIVHIEALQSSDLPIRMEDALLARLERLEAESRLLLERACVMGEVFWDRALLALTRSESPPFEPVASPMDVWPHDEDEAGISSSLRRLVDRGFIEALKDSEIPLARAYRFTHPALGTLLYQRLSPALRSRRHAVVAEWLVSTSEHLMAMAAPHLERAGRFEQAGIAYLEAAKAEYAQLQTRRALRSVERALEFLHPDEVRRRLEALHLHGSVLVILGRYEEALRSFTEMLRESWRLGALGKGGAALNRIARLHLSRGHLEEARLPLLRGLELFRKANDITGVASSLDDLAQLELLCGHLDAALSASLEALEIRRKMGDTRGEALSLSTIGKIQHSRGNLDQAEEAFRAALRLREAAGDRVGTMRSLNEMAVILFERGDSDGARAAWLACLNEARAIGDRRMEAMVLNNLGESLIDLGKANEAESFLLEAQSIALELFDKRIRAEVERNLGRVALALQRKDAISALEAALESALDYGGKQSIAQAHHELARAYLTLAQNDEHLRQKAKTHFQQAIELYQSLGNTKLATQTMAEFKHLLEKEGIERHTHQSNP